MFYTRPVRQDGYFLTKRKIPQHFYCGILAEKERFEHGQGHGPSPCLPDWLVESSNLLRSEIEKEKSHSISAVGFWRRRRDSKYSYVFFRYP